MRIVVSGGGTAGHINPALALSEVLTQRGHQVLFAGTAKGAEARLVPQAGIPFVTFEATGFNRSHPATLVKALRDMFRSTKKAKKLFAQDKPDVVVGFGGYVSIPVARAAEQMGIPVILHEQNSVMGLANKYLSRKASVVCLTYQYAAKDVRDQSKVVVTGNPVRKKVLEATRAEGRALLGVPEDAFLLLVFGGSLGARHINTAICALKERLLALPNVYVVHITGPKELETVQAALNLTEEERTRYIVMGYQDRMGETLAATDFIVSRAGASSLAEISARGIPALLVPFPYATENHQTYNAQSLVETGCAVMIPDDQVETDAFSDTLFALLTSPEKLSAMHEAALAQKTADSANIVADLVISAPEGGSALQ